MSDVSRVEELFLNAVGRQNSAERMAYLDAQCGPDAELRRRVEVLLAAQSKVGGFLEPQADLTGAYQPKPTKPEATAAVGDRIGPYKLLEKIGEGGMGEVWVADQLEPIKRRVALKLIKPGMDSRSVLGRFEAERQALAVMDHPNIAKVLDAGTTTDGRPYFVMELVKGTPITEFADARKLTPKQRLELFVPVCQAIQHAHMKGIIHRDIKPSNVLVALHDETPVPKVIDFGVAKAVGQQLTENTIYTGFGALVGTPTYMAPEQATFNQLDVDTRADVYALGVLLYELLAGSPPIEKERLKKAALDEVLRIVRDEEPPRPSARLSTSQAKASIAATRGSEPAKLSALMKGELDWIVMKALEKDRTRRYETANGFAADVQRYLCGEQVQAVPPSLGYRLKKMYRRNKAAVWVSMAFTLLILSAAVISGYLAIRATSAEQKAEQDRDVAREAERKETEQRELAQKKAEEAIAARDEARRTHYAAQMNLAQNAFNTNDGPACLRLLDELKPKPGEKDLRGIEWHYLCRQFHTYERAVPLPDSGGQSFNIFSRDGKRIVHVVLAKAADPKTPPIARLIVRELPGAALVNEILVELYPPQIAKPPIGNPSVVGGFVDYKTEAFKANPLNSLTMELSDNASVLLLKQNGRYVSFDTQSGRVLFSRDRPIILPEPWGQTDYAAASLSGDGKRAIVVDFVREKAGLAYVLIDVTTGKELWSRPSDPKQSYEMRLNFDGKMITYGTPDEAVLVDATTFEVKAKFPKLYRGTTSSTIELNRDGTRLISRCLVPQGIDAWPTPVHTEIWDVAKKERLIGDEKKDTGLEVNDSYAGEVILQPKPGVNTSRLMAVLDPATRQEITVLRPPVPILNWAVDPRGSVYGVSDQAELYVWTVTVPRINKSDPSFVSDPGTYHKCFAATQNGDRFAFVLSNSPTWGAIKNKDQPKPKSSLTLRKGVGGQLLKTLDLTEEQQLCCNFNPKHVAFDPTGTYLHGIYERQVKPGDPKSIASCCLWRWDTQTNRLEVYGDKWDTVGINYTSFLSSPLYYSFMTLNPEGDTIAVVTSRPQGGGYEYALILLDLKTGQRRHTTEFVERQLHNIEFTPDGKSLRAMAIDPADTRNVSVITFERNTGRVTVTVPFMNVMPRVRRSNKLAGDVFAYVSSHEPIKPKSDNIGMAITGQRTYVTVHDVRTGERLCRIEEQGKEIMDIDLSQDGRTLACYFEERSLGGGVFGGISPIAPGGFRSVRLFSLPDGRELGTAFDGKAQNVRMLFSPDSTRLLVIATLFSNGGGLLRQLSISDARTGRLLTSTPLEMNNRETQWSADGRKLILGVQSMPSGQRFDSSRTTYGVLDFSPLPEPKK